MPELSERKFVEGVPLLSEPDSVALPVPVLLELELLISVFSISVVPVSASASKDLVSLIVEFVSTAPCDFDESMSVVEYVELFLVLPSGYEAAEESTDVVAPVSSRNAPVPEG